MVWAIIKKKIKGKKFANVGELFMGVEEEWNRIPQETIDSLVGSFEARCRVCIEQNGGPLNGHWDRVHELHHQLDPANVPE
jgi:hypothetical protein